MQGVSYAVDIVLCIDVTGSGSIYLKGYGVPQDEKKSAYWFILAAEQVEPRGRYLLGLMYLEGRGVQENQQQAMYWIRWAARHSHADARTALERLEGSK